LEQKFQKSRNKSYKYIGTKITKIQETKLQKSGNKNPGTKVTKIRNKNYTNAGMKVNKNGEQKLQKSGNKIYKNLRTKILEQK
jgi:hypothetical protein